MIGTITHILAKAGYKAMNGPLADERRRLAGAVPPAAYVSYDPRMLAGAGWYGYRIALKGGDRSMLERARYMLEQQYVIRDSYEYYADDIYTLGVLMRQRVPHYGIGGGGAAQEPDALNFYMPDGGTITLTRNGTPTVVELEYSIDGGATWQVWEEVGNVRSLTLAAGQKMYVRNTSETSTEFSTAYNAYYKFSHTTDAYAGGNVNSLLCKNPNNAEITVYCLYELFYGDTHLITAPDMPSTILKRLCYGYMYSNCSSLVMMAYLPAQIIPVNAYYHLCEKCSSLSTIKTAMTDISAGCTEDWLKLVAATGDFYCPSTLTIPANSANGIPTGWTRHDI